MSRKVAISDNERRERNRDAQRKHRYKKAAKLKFIEERLTRYEDIFQDLKTAKNQQNLSQLLTLIDIADNTLHSNISFYDSTELKSQSTLRDNTADNILYNDPLSLYTLPLEKNYTELGLMDNIYSNVPLLLGGQEVIPNGLFTSQGSIKTIWD